MSKVFEIKQWTYRYIKYRLLRPSPLRDDGLFGKDVIVVGSAPFAQRPVGLSDDYTVVTVNGSQKTLRTWTDSKPYATIMMFNQIEGTNTNAREVRRVLGGEATGKLYLMLWRHGRERLEAGLASFRYGYEKLEIVDRYRRVALVKAVTGKLNFELDASTKYSNGMIAVLLALHSGARSVILTGINPSSSGHVYNSENLTRLHVGMDSELIQTLRTMHAPIYTADPDVAAATGLPMWTGAPGVMPQNEATSAR